MTHTLRNKCSVDNKKNKCSKHMLYFAMSSGDKIGHLQSSPNIRVCTKFLSTIFKGYGYKKDKMHLGNC